MTDMTCKVLYGITNWYGSFVPISSTLISDRIPYARRRARDRARWHTKASDKYCAEVYTLSDSGRWINCEVWKGGYQID